MRAPAQRPVLSRALLLGLLLGLLWLPAGNATSPAAVSPAAALAAPAAAAPLKVLSSTHLTARLDEFELSTPYLQDSTFVRVLRPVGYDRDRSKRWPVLLLLHGCCDRVLGADGYSAWTDQGNAEELTQQGKFLVVMPAGGDNGYYSDHYGIAGEGGPAWESYHIRQLLPWVDRTYRTAATRAERAVVGLSMGGFGAMSYAARHPDLFSYAEAYSGAVDLTLGTKGTPVHTSTVEQSLVIADSRPPQSVFGPWETEEVRSRAHNPVDLIGNLADTVVTLRTGNGKESHGITTDPIEDTVHDQTVSLHNALSRAGLSHTFDDYGAGGHAWEFWMRDLSLLIAPLNAHFARATTAMPTSFTYTTAEASGEVYGYRFSSDRGFPELATLQVDGPDLTVSASGVLTLTTPASYSPRQRYSVRAVRNGVASTTRLTADSLGRLSFAVDTGKRSTGQQYRATSTTNLGQVQLHISRA